LRQAYDYWQDQPGNCRAARSRGAIRGRRRRTLNGLHEAHKGQRVFYCTSTRGRQPNEATTMRRSSPSRDVFYQSPSEHPLRGRNIQDSRMLNRVTRVQRNAPGVKTFAVTCRTNISQKRTPSRPGHGTDLSSARRLIEYGRKPVMEFSISFSRLLHI
jgi:hypothetical protein